jgi:glycerophosphoryl diester phosphodiesterase
MPSRPLRLAHRGDWRHAPENTLPAFRAALAVPACDGLEFDVRAAADGVPVVIHDGTLGRVQRRPGRVDALPASVLAEAGVPTLAEVLAEAGPEPFLDVELKVDAGRAVVEVLTAARGPALPQTVISSFLPAALEAVARLAPQLPLWLNTSTLGADAIAQAMAIGCRGVSVEWRALDQVSVERARAAGLDVASWTVRRRPTFDRLARLGVIAVCVEAAALDGPGTPVRSRRTPAGRMR